MFLNSYSWFIWFPFPVIHPHGHRHTDLDVSATDVHAKDAVVGAPFYPVDPLLLIVKVQIHHVSTGLSHHNSVSLRQENIPACQKALCVSVDSVDYKTIKL